MFWDLVSGVGWVGLPIFPATRSFSLSRWCSEPCPGQDGAHPELLPSAPLGMSPTSRFRGSRTQTREAQASGTRPAPRPPGSPGCALAPPPAGGEDERVCPGACAQPFSAGLLPCRVPSGPASSAQSGPELTWTLELKT